VNPPREVSLSVYISALSCAAGVAYSIIERGATASYATWATWGFACWLVYLYLRSLWLGRRWAWWLTLSFGLYGVASLPWVLQHPPKYTSTALYLSQTVACVSVTVLLLLPRSRAWFRPNKSFKPNPLRGSA
jgi:uncharacterized membrane protein YedE/YeeE